MDSAQQITHPGKPHLPATTIVPSSWFGYCKKTPLALQQSPRAFGWFGFVKIPTAPPIFGNETILVNAELLKQNFEDHFACRECVRAGTFKSLLGFIEWLDTRRKGITDAAISNPLDKMLEALRKKLVSDETTNWKLWHSYTHTPEYRQSIEGKNTHKVNWHSHDTDSQLTLTQTVIWIH